MIGAALVVAALAFLFLSGGDDDEDSTPTRTAAAPTLEGEPTASVPAPEPKPEFDRIRIVNGSVSGGEPKITVSKGDVARFEVRSDTPDEIHVHGYDITKPVTPAKAARFRIDADIEGIFEIEAHDLGHLVIGTLVVEP